MAVGVNCGCKLDLDPGGRGWWGSGGGSDQGGGGQGRGCGGQG